MVFRTRSAGYGDAHFFVPWPGGGPFPRVGCGSQRVSFGPLPFPFEWPAPEGDGAIIKPTAPKMATSSTAKRRRITSLSLV